jgi:energy-coupling factor transporter ATP-binding protein EcfA2
MSRYQIGVLKIREEINNKLKNLKEKVQKSNMTKTQKAIELLENISEETIIDQDNTIYVALKIDDHRKLLNLKSENFKKILQAKYYQLTDETISSSSISEIIQLYSGNAILNSSKVKMNLRVAGNDKSIYYDLGNSKWEVIEISPGNWKKISSENSSVYFKRYSHMKEQIEPLYKSNDKGDPKKILDYLNIENESDEAILLLTYMASLFIPKIVHPILILLGPHGSAKSTMFRLIQRIVDPTETEVLNIPTNTEEYIQKTAHSWLSFYDNVAKISRNLSDAMCRTVTGGSHNKRELFSDDEDFIHKFKHCVGINGIQFKKLQPDLLDRSIILNMDQITGKSRKLEINLMDNFEDYRRIIFTGFLNLIAEAMEIVDDIDLNRVVLPRLADFYKWGIAFAKVLGYGQQKFERAFNLNNAAAPDLISQQKSIIKVVDKYLNDNDKWSGTASELRSELIKFANDNDMNSNIIPDSPEWLSREINKYSKGNILKKIGIEFNKKRSNSKRLIEFSKTV